MKPMNDILAMKRNQDKQTRPSLLRQVEAQLFNVYEGLCPFENGRKCV